MSNVAIITANIGAIDQIKGIPRQSIDVDYYCYFDNNLPFPLPNLNNRLKSKYVKIQTHRFLPQYDAYIWIDGRVEVTADVFAEEMIKAMGVKDVAIFSHPERKILRHEAVYIIQEMKKGNPYLISRYANQCMELENDFYRECEAADLPLYACTIFARKNNPKTNEAFNEWWRRCIEFSYFDQTMFSVISQGLDIKVLDRKDFRDQFVIGNHVKNV